LCSPILCARIADMEGKLRRARAGDVPTIHRLINHFAERDEMLPRSLNELYENLRDYFVVESAGEVVGCCALHVTWGDLAEIKGLAVREDHQGSRLGGRLVEACMNDARALGLPRVFVLTYISRYFEQFGFQQVEKSELPHKVWSECIRCPKFPDCGEVSMVIDIG
jgi:amino-acid N-acetyltransferase